MDATLVDIDAAYKSGLAPVDHVHEGGVGSIIMSVVATEAALPVSAPIDGAWFVTADRGNQYQWSATPQRYRIKSGNAYDDEAELDAMALAGKYMVDAGAVVTVGGRPYMRVMGEWIRQKSALDLRWPTQELRGEIEGLRCWITNDGMVHVSVGSALDSSGTQVITLFSEMSKNCHWSSASPYEIGDGARGVISPFQPQNGDMYHLFLWRYSATVDLVIDDNMNGDNLPEHWMRRWICPISYESYSPARMIMDTGGSRVHISYHDNHAQWATGWTQSGFAPADWSAMLPDVDERFVAWSPVGTGGTANRPLRYSVDGVNQSRRFIVGDTISPNHEQGSGFDPPLPGWDQTPSFEAPSSVDLYLGHLWLRR